MDTEASCEMDSRPEEKEKKIEREVERDEYFWMTLWVNPMPSGIMSLSQKENLIAQMKWEKCHLASEYKSIFSSSFSPAFRCQMKCHSFETVSVHISMQQNNGNPLYDCYHYGWEKVYPLLLQNV